jgi:hypothetical protein
MDFHKDHKTFSRSFAFVLAFATVNAVNAAPQPAQILSYGSDSCARFIQAAAQDKQMYLSYVVGFISGANTRDVGKGRLAGTNWDEAGITVWLSSYCTQNPLAPFASAVEALRVTLGGNALTQ